MHHDDFAVEAPRELKFAKKNRLDALLFCPQTPQATVKAKACPQFDGEKKLSKVPVHTNSDDAIMDVRNRQHVVTRVTYNTT